MVTYAIIDGSDKFAIDSLGRVTLRQSLPQGRYTARIRASDGGVPSKSTDEALTVIIGETAPDTECPQFASGSLSRSVTILEAQSPEVCVYDATLLIYMACFGVASPFLVMARI